MAHATRINELTSGLAQSIVGEGRRDAAFKQLRSQTVRGLRSGTHARTNQFEVKSKLDGLVEKFAVLNREDLSEALQVRLDELPTKSKWMPEILSLLLQLSDRPLEETKLEDVALLGKQPEDDLQALTWDDLMADAPFDQADIWDDIERGYHSSGDDVTVDGEGDSDETTSTQATSVGEEDIAALARLQVMQPDISALDETISLHSAFRDDSNTASVSELTLVREVLLMLRGLPTSVFALNQSTGQVSYRPQFGLATATKSTLNDMAQQLAEIGSSIHVLRQWTRSAQHIAYLQSCQSSVQHILTNFGSQLGDIEQRYLSPSTDIIVTLPGVRKELENRAKPLLNLSRIVKLAKTQRHAFPFAMLDALYDEACTAQLCGDNPLFNMLAQVLLAGLKTYLKSISRWIQTGSISDDDSTSLAAEANNECQLGRIWHERFALRTTSDGRPSVPTFMRPFASKIFAMGKSRAFLQALNEDRDGVTDDCSNSSLNTIAIEERLKSNDTLPFFQVLEDSLDSWLTESSQDCTPLLRHKLLYEHGAKAAIDVLNRIFCSQNGVLFQTFADTLFWRIDQGDGTWRNSFLLSELAQSVLGATTTDGLTIRLEEETNTEPSTSSIRQLETLILETVFSWPIQNITHTRTPATHPKIFVLLLQLYRAKQLLRRQQPYLRMLDSRTAQLPQLVVQALNLRQHLISTVDILYSHTTSTAQVVGSLLSQDIEAADGIDDMAAVWELRLKQLETSLLLAPKLASMRGTITSLLELCEQFSKIWQRTVETQTSSITADGDIRDDSTPARDILSTLQNETQKSLLFLVAGLRGVGRAGGNTALETLAERLEWSVH